MTMTRASLIASTFYAYLYPSSKLAPCPGGLPQYVYTSGSSCVAYPGIPVSSGSQAPIVDGNCQTANNPLPCTVTIHNIPYNPGESYLVHFYDLYDAVTLTAYGGDSVGQFNFSNSQDIIDVTGQARNVLKRVQVRISPNPPIQAPSNAIQTQDICKHFQTSPLSPETSFYNSNGTIANSGPCLLN
jgi:hypothetical protein